MVKIVYGVNGIMSRFIMDKNEMLLCLLNDKNNPIKPYEWKCPLHDVVYSFYSIGLSYFLIQSYVHFLSKRRNLV